MMMAKNEFTNSSTGSGTRTRGGDPPGTLLSVKKLQLNVNEEDDGDDNVNDNTGEESQPTVVELDRKSFKTLSHQRDDDSQITVPTLPEPQQQEPPEPLQESGDNGKVVPIAAGNTEDFILAGVSLASNVVSIPENEAVSPTPVDPAPGQTSTSSSRHLEWNQDLRDDSQRSIPTATMDVPMSPTTTSSSKQPRHRREPSVLTNSRPTNTFGAHRVTKIRSPNTNQYKVMVPESVQPGTDFLVEIPEPDTDTAHTANNNNNHNNCRHVQVTCPLDIVPGDPNQNIIDIIVPVPSVHWYYALKVAQLTTSPTTSSTVAGKTFPMVSHVRRINEQATNMGGTIRTQVITIPDHAMPGKEFSYYIDGHIQKVNNVTNGKGKRQKLKITCPDKLKPGDRLRIVLPAELPEPEPIYQLFNVIVPDGVRPGGQFAVEIGLGNTQQVLVECPADVKPGDMISIQLPTRTLVDKFQALTYPSTGTGWKRTVRLSDLHFQWVRLEESLVRAPKSSSMSMDDDMTVNTDGAVRSSKHTQRAISSVDWTYYHEKAYVRKLVHLEGNDPRLRTASLTLVSAETASAPSKLKTNNGILLFSYAEIAYQQCQPLHEKHRWFLDVCQRLAEYASTTTTDTTNTTIMVPTDHSMSQSVLLLVRREHLLTDSLRAILSLSIEDMKRNWEIVFVGESGIDQGGLTKEWLQCVTEQIFLPSTGLFVTSLNNQAAVDINAASAIACPQYHLLYFRFIGRVLGRALFTGQLVQGHFVRLLYKHLLGWPITIEDIRDQDDGYYDALHEIVNMDDASLASVCLDFTAAEEFGKVRMSHELIENGSNVQVCRENLASYVDARIRYHLFDRILPQLTELLLGFYDVVPEEALAVFDANELELVLSGLPRIDVDDWLSNTCYVGIFETGEEQVVKWFWEIIRDEYNIEMKARLLQFVTGTSGVPPGGFACLKGGDDAPRKFTVQGVELATSIYPKAHTCFNVLDLPNYSTKDELQKRLTFSITTSYVGFEAE